MKKTSQNGVLAPQPKQDPASEQEDPKQQDLTDVNTNRMFLIDEKSVNALLDALTALPWKQANPLIQFIQQNVKVA